jgi:hypothetical protein
MLEPGEPELPETGTGYKILKKLYIRKGAPIGRAANCLGGCAGRSREGKYDRPGGLIR